MGLKKMATIALPRPIPSGHTRSSSPHPLTPTLSLDSINTSAACPIPIPNEHLPVCPPGPAPSEKPDTPPQSPPSKEITLQSQSLLYPPNKYKSRTIGATTIYEIDPDGVAAALDHIAGQPLPDPSQVFPWFHGLHPCNHIQQAFFIARRKNLRKTPKCLRGLTLVKAGGDLSCSRLKGSNCPGRVSLTRCDGALFREIDPKEGFSVRNFQIQAAKSAMLSDILVYGEDSFEVERLAKDVAAAQQAWRGTHQEKGHEILKYNTFICTSPFEIFEQKYPEIVSTDSRGQMTGRVMDFFHQERIEMCTMTKASEIHHNVWLGPTPDPAIDPALLGADEQFNILIECSDLGRLNPGALQALAGNPSDQGPAYFEFPSSGSIMPPTWSHAEVDAILETCRWLYNLSHGILPPSPSTVENDAEGDSPMPSPAPTQDPREEDPHTLHRWIHRIHTLGSGLFHLCYRSSYSFSMAGFACSKTPQLLRLPFRCCSPHHYCPAIALRISYEYREDSFGHHGTCKGRTRMDQEYGRISTQQSYRLHVSWKSWPCK